MARLLAGLDWRTVALLAEPEFSRLAGRELAQAGVCVVDSEAVPSLLHTKDSYTGLLSDLAEAGVDRLVVAADGADIGRLVGNIIQLNLNISVLAVPWDGAVQDMPPLPQAVEVLQLVQTFSNMPEVVADLGLEGREDVRSWEVVRQLYGLLVVGDPGVDEDTARAGLGLGRERQEWRLERLRADTAGGGWATLGVLGESGQLSWAGSSPAPLLSTGETELHWECVNGLARSSRPVWRSGELWLTGLGAGAGLGLLSCLLLAGYLCSHCGQVLEGSQLTSFCLLAATSLSFLALAPFCLLPLPLVCALRQLGPPLVSSLVLAMMTSRSLLLATADTDGLPGHASGVVQVVLGLTLLGVEAALLLPLSLQQGEESWTELVRRGRVSSLTCRHHLTPLSMAWPGLLLLLQLCLSPAIWRSRRNYREGTLFSLASLALCLLAAGWAAVYWVCSALYGQHWQEISTAAGLLSLGSTVLLVIFLPKVYMMARWGRGSEISLHLPDTATSTLHTDTIDYVRGPVVSESERTVMYDNNPGNRRALSQILGQYNSYRPEPGLPLGLVGLPGLSTASNGSTYKLDANTEPETNISWEPFLGSGGHRASPGNPHNGVSSMFISNMEKYGYGYTSDLSQDNFVKHNPSTNL